MKVKIEIELIDFDKHLSDIIFNSILPEKIDDKLVNINKDLGKFVIKANTISRGRAIMNSYISWIYSILRTIGEVKNS
jgi:tRNA threonylcarbamoyladenosine modification (KEOPS) complex  Pcc1 subunit